MDAPEEESEHDWHDERIGVVDRKHRRGYVELIQ